MLPNPDVLNDFSQGKFVLSNLAAKRALQLKQGAIPLVSIGSNHPLTIALAEIAAGKIKPVVATPVDPLIDTVETTLRLDETVPAEFGMLLPALDETEASLIAELEEIEVDPAAIVDEEQGLSLSDLGDEEAEEEEVVASDDEDTLSLSELAADEEALDEDGVEE